jgi:hypothetical protein
VFDGFLLSDGWERGSLRGALLLKKLRTIFEMIKVEHTIFALPFAFLGGFITVNGWISILLFVTAGLDIIWRKS